MVTSASGIRRLIKRSISLAAIAMAFSPAPSGRLARHIGWEPALEALAQLCHQNGALAFERQCIATGQSELPRGYVGAASARNHRLGHAGLDSQNIAALILAEPEGVRRHRRAIELGAKARGHRHLGDSGQKPAVGYILHGPRQALGHRWPA